MLQKTVRRPAPERTSALKTFHLNDILSLATGLPLAREGQAAVHRLVAFVMESDAHSSTTAANAETVKRCLEEQLPFLREINFGGLYQIYQYDSDGDPDDGQPENPYLDVWLEMQALRHGAEHALLPFSRWQQQKAAPPAPKSAAGTAC